MKRLKVLGVALAALFVLAAMTMTATAMALELPDIHTALSGENYPIRASGEAKVTVRKQLQLINAEARLSAT